jgi:hypothetical protein
MSRKLFLIVTLSILSFSTALLPTPVRAEIPLTFADIQALLRQVRLQPKNQSPRPAQVRERMTPGDALSTARSSRADLRFNDGSLARVGELALFRFFPNTRRFNLSNGTALLIIPPGRGTTNVTTPNVSAGIRGSALFVRVDKQTNTTIVGALTNSGITVTDNGTNRIVELKAGQLAVVDPRGLRLFDFDLTTFYQTSDLVRGLNLDQKPSDSSSDKGIAAVQGETSEALGKQEKIQDDKLVQNPDFIRLSPQPPGFPQETIATPPIVGVQIPIGKPGAPESFIDRGTLNPVQTTPSTNPPVANPNLGSLPSDPRVPVQTPVVTPPQGQTPVVTPVPIVSPVTPAPVTPAPIATPVTSPVQVPPAPIYTPPVTPAPVAAPVAPPLQLEVVPKAPAAIQIVPSPTPNAAPTVPANNPSTSAVAPTPTLAPTLAPTVAPVLPLDGKSTPVQAQPASKT